MNSLLKRGALLLGFLLGVVGTGLQAQAGYYVKFDNVSPGHGPAGQYNWHFVDNTSQHNAIAGPAGIKYTDVGQSHFTTFCVETQQHISGGSVYSVGNPTSNYQFVTLESAPTTSGNITIGSLTISRANALREMWAKWHGTLNGNDAFAAFQFAVWFIAGQPLSSNTGTPSGNVLTLETKYLNTSYWNSNNKADLAIMHSGSPGNYQDQLLELEGGGGNLLIVPAPPAILLAFAGIVPCFALRRRLTARAA